MNKPKRERRKKVVLPYQNIGPGKRPRRYFKSQTLRQQRRLRYDTY
jgi:hypothetical protein